MDDAICKSKGHKQARSLSSRLAAYAVASGASLLAAGSANAGIIYSGPENIPVGPGATVPIDLNGDGQTDITFTQGAFTAPIVYPFSETGVSLSVAGNGSNQVTSTSGAIDSIPYGTMINSLSGYSSNGYLMSRSSVKFYTEVGPAKDSGNYLDKTGYFGVQFTDLSSQTHYGWVQFTGVTGTPDTPGQLTGTIVDWAYESTPNVGIDAGATSGGDPSAVPEPSSLALLAIGATGLGIWRLRRKARDMMPATT